MRHEDGFFIPWMKQSINLPAVQFSVAPPAISNTTIPICLRIRSRYPLSGFRTVHPLATRHLSPSYIPTDVVVSFVAHRLYIQNNQLQNQPIGSPRRKPGSSILGKYSIPAFAGMASTDFCIWLPVFFHFHYPWEYAIGNSPLA